MLCFFAVSAVTEYREHVREILRADSFQIVLGLLIVAIGIGAGALLVLRRPSKDRALLWFGVFALFYGSRLLLYTNTIPFVLSFSEHTVDSWENFLTYVMPIPGTFFVYEVFPPLRRVLRWVLAVYILFAIAAIATDLVTGRAGSLHTANNVLALANWLAAGIAVFWYSPAVPFVGALKWGVAVFGVSVILGNLRGLGMPGLPIDPEPIGFAFFLGALGRVLAVRALESQDRLRALNKELEIATRIQQSILPQALPPSSSLKIAARYVPMTAVAGDFYDFLRIDDRRIGVLIADVTGHGVPAALIASMVKIAIAAQLPHADDPGKVLSGINQTLTGKMQGQFVSAAYLYLDLDAHQFRYAGGGHPPLLWWSAQTEHVEALEENGLLVGIMAGAQYTFMERGMSRGDRFLLYTDGLVEAANTQDEFFGEERLRGVLTEARRLEPGDCIDTVLDHLSRFAAHDRGQPQEDDLTLIVLDVL